MCPIWVTLVAPGVPEIHSPYGILIFVTFGSLFGNLLARFEQLWAQFCSIWGTFVEPGVPEINSPYGLLIFVNDPFVSRYLKWVIGKIPKMCCHLGSVIQMGHWENPQDVLSSR